MPSAQYRAHTNEKLIEFLNRLLYERYSVVMYDLTNTGNHLLFIMFAK